MIIAAGIPFFFLICFVNKFLFCLSECVYHYLIYIFLFVFAHKPELMMHFYVGLRSANLPCTWWIITWFMPTICVVACLCMLFFCSLSSDTLHMLANLHTWLSIANYEQFSIWENYPYTPRIIWNNHFTPTFIVFTIIRLKSLWRSHLTLAVTDLSQTITQGGLGGGKWLAYPWL